MVDTEILHILGMLYYTEDYGDDIPPGEYQIQVCYKYSSNIGMILDIII